MIDKLDLEAQDKDNARIWQMEADLESARNGRKPFEYFQIKNSPKAGIEAADAFLEVLARSDEAESPAAIFKKARAAARKANGKPLYDYS